MSNGSIIIIILLIILWSSVNNLREAYMNHLRIYHKYKEKPKEKFSFKKWWKRLTSFEKFFYIFLIGILILFLLAFVWFL